MTDDMTLETTIAIHGTDMFSSYSKMKVVDHDGKRVRNVSNLYSIEMRVVKMKDENGKWYVAFRTYHAVNK